MRELAKLRDSEELKKIMFEIEKYSKVSRKSADIIGPVESDPEYQLIVEANNMAVDIDNEIGNSFVQMNSVSKLILLISFLIYFLIHTFIFVLCSYNTSVYKG